MKVKIISVIASNAWYADRIGEIYEIDEAKSYAEFLKIRECDANYDTIGREIIEQKIKNFEDIDYFLHIDDVTVLI